MLGLRIKGAREGKEYFTGRAVYTLGKLVRVKSWRLSPYNVTFCGVVDQGCALPETNLVALFQVQS